MCRKPAYLPVQSNDRPPWYMFHILSNMGHIIWDSQIQIISIPVNACEFFINGYEFCVPHCRTKIGDRLFLNFERNCYAMKIIVLLI